MCTTIHSVGDFGPNTQISQSVHEFFHGQSIFITGGLGYLGKVLVEKLLRSCSGLDTIYMLIRPKRGSDPQERLKIMSESKLFDRLKQENPKALFKLRAVTGDVTQLGLGLSDTDRRMLEENVSVVFHSAASVRFNDPLKNAILLNARGTLEVVKLASCMKQLKVILHVSTTYCNLDYKILPEMVLPSYDDWRTFIEVAETCDTLTLDIITKKILGHNPNTYTFTKCLAEQIINDHRDKLPVVIVRPSIVLPTFCDPVPGWIDNFNGSIGIRIASGKGILHVMYLNTDITLDYIPVDIANKAIILAAWRRAFQGVLSHVPVYNAAGSASCMKEKYIAAMGDEIIKEHPLPRAVYWPFTYITSNLFLYCTLFFLMQIPQALLLDTLLWITGKKPLFMKIQRKIFVAVMSLKRFSMTEWTFSNECFKDLEQLLYPGEKEDFAYNQESFVQYAYLKNCVLGACKYLLKEEMNAVKDKKHINRLRNIHYSICTVLVILLGWTLYTYPVHIWVFSKLITAIRLVFMI